MRILHVDNDVGSRDIVTYVLEQAGHEVATASTPDVALAVARNGRFDLFILENRYQTESGVELCKKIRGFDPGARILFYLSQGNEMDISDGLAAGAKAYVLKPELDNLQAAIECLRADASINPIVGRNERNETPWDALQEVLKPGAQRQRVANKSVHIRGGVASASATRG